MKILFISPSYKPAYCYGGPTVSVSELAETLVQLGNEVTIYTTTANGKTELKVKENERVMLNGVSVYYFKRLTGDHTHISFALWNKLNHTIDQFDIIHLQSWWSILIAGSAVICTLKKKKYIISPRGMLSAYTFKTGSSFYKKILHQLIGKRLLKNSFLHATSDLEWKELLQLSKKIKGFIAYNLVDLPELIEPGESRLNEILTIGFLSRIDPKKGLEILFHALSKMNFNYKLLIAGSGDPHYIHSLETLSKELGISNYISWTGWKDKQEKFDFFKSIDLSVLTSYNENFAVTVTESLSVGCPVLISEHVGLSDYVKSRHIGWICKANSKSIQDVLLHINNNRNELVKIKKKASSIIKSDFNKKALAQKYCDQYELIVSGTILN